jgi:4-amino-4-deoxy-L-arabinose transferase-like glycosyltransferase
MRWLEWAFVLMLFASALAVRVYRLDEIPPGLWLDEAANGLDVMTILEGQHAIFFERNKGREPLFFYLQALVAHWIGVSPFGLRLTAALVGAATVVTTYGMVRTLFQATSLPAVWLAGWSALLLAFSYWHITLSRLGLRAITLPLLATLTFFFFWRAWPRLASNERFPWTDLLLCGGMTGLALYTYTASRFIPVLIVVTVGVGLLLAGRLALSRLRLIGALCVIGLVATLVFAPLGFYFLQHPEVFISRAAEISIFRTTAGGTSPLLALAHSVGKTAAMFVADGDPNFRHNPAGRPIFDPLLAIWFVVGITVAALHSRNVRYGFLLLWLGVLALPAVLTTEGTPHALRGIGMTPVATTLPALGMVWVGQRLVPRWRMIVRWLPLPFLLFSAAFSTRDYFGAWADPQKNSRFFLTDYVRVGQAMAEQTAPGTVWLLPLSASYQLSEGAWSPFYTIEFFVRNQAAYGSIIANEEQAPRSLAELTAGHRFAQVFRIRDAAFFDEFAYVFDDTKNLVEFLLTKHGQLVGLSDGAAVGVPYRIYTLPPTPDYRFAEAPSSIDRSFANTVRLTALDYGRTRLDLAEPTTMLSARTAPAGHRLWLVLRWQAQVPIDVDLKSSLLLKDAAGHVAGQVDDLLVGDHYPAFRVWPSGEAASSYHILPIASGLPPGDYGLYLKVYEDRSGRIYPASAERDQPIGTEAPIGRVTITPGATGVVLTPTQVLAEPTQLAPNLTLTGYDLPRTQVAPGDTLPLTLYWQAQNTPAEAYRAVVRLMDASGTAVAENTSPPGGVAYPTTQWRPAETLRNWHDLAIPATLPMGSYTLTVGVSSSTPQNPPLTLGLIEVGGRPRLFAPPAALQPAGGGFGGAVDLLGLETPAELTITPGAVLTFTLVWQPQTTPESALIRFVHLLGADGRPVAQQDTVPCDGACPTLFWLPDEVLLDPVTLILPGDLPAGDYRLAVGWYDQETQQRLPAFAQDGQPLPDGLLGLPVQLKR